MTGGMYFVIILLLNIQVVLLTGTTRDPIIQNFEDEMNDQEKFLKADLNLIKTTITSKLLNLLNNGFLSIERNVSKDYKDIEPVNTEGYNVECLNNLKSNIDLDFEIYNLQLKFSGCGNLTHSNQETLRLLNDNNVLTENLNNLTNVIISEVEFACRKKTGFLLLLCIRSNTETHRERYNDLYQQILSENKIVNGELMLYILQEQKCFDSIVNEISKLINELYSQFENCKNSI